MITSVDFFYLAHYFEYLFTRLATLIFDEVTFARFQPALQNQNKFLIFASETNRDRRLVLYTCLSPPIVSGRGQDISSGFTASRGKQPGSLDYTTTQFFGSLRSRTRQKF